MRAINVNQEESPAWSEVPDPAVAPDGVIVMRSGGQNRLGERISGLPWHDRGVSRDRESFGEWQCDILPS